MKAEGYAVTDEHDVINIATVSPTEMGTMVNWLVLKAGIVPTAGTMDATIANAFLQMSNAIGHNLRKVSIEVIE